MRNKKIDLIILILFPIVSSVAAFLFKANAFFSVILFLGIPSLYLSLKERNHIKKAAFFSLLGLPIIIFVDYIAHLTNAWVIPVSVLPYRLLGYVSLEVILWTFFQIYLVIMFYEYFLEEHVRDKIWYPRTKYLVLIVFGLLLIFFGFFFTAQNLLYIPYWYLIFGLSTILLPVILQALAFPRTLLKILKVVPYFFFLTFIYEITALKLGWWAFPGTEFVGWVSFFGVRFPFEEFSFWLMLLAVALLSYYEFYDDDEK